MRALSAGRERMEAELARLVACDTSFPPGAGYAAFADLIEALLAPLGGEARRIEVPEALWAAPGARGPRVNLIARPALGSADAPELTIYFHADTAPVGHGWIRPPLRLTVEGERLYGRGTADMKGAMAASLAALRALREAGAALAFRPVLAFCTDEEGGRHPGVRHLAERGLLAEPILNLNGGATPRVWAGCFGSIDLAFRFVGRAAHSGDPGDGVNAVEAAAPALEALLALKREVERRTSALPPPPWRDGPLTARLSVTRLRAGEKGSALPGLFEMVVNRRYAPEEEADAVVAEIRATVAEAVAGGPLIDWSMEETGHLPPVVDPDGPLTERWTQAQSAGFGVPREAFRRFGSSTSSDFGWVQRAGLSEIMLGGLSRPDANVHGPDEHTTRADLMGLAQSVALFLDADFDPDAPSEGALASPTEETAPS